MSKAADLQAAEREARVADLQVELAKALEVEAEAASELKADERDEDLGAVSLAESRARAAKATRDRLRIEAAIEKLTSREERRAERSTEPSFRGATDAVESRPAITTRLPVIITT